MPAAVKKPSRSTSVTWVRVTDRAAYLTCNLCRGQVKVGEVALQSFFNSRTITQHKLCLQKALEQSPFEIYDEIVANLHAGKDLFPDD